mgnify:CR=1 FL=1
MSTIITAVITGVVSLVTCLIMNNASTEKTRALMDYRLESLEKKLDKFDEVYEKVIKLETRVELLEKGS